MEECNVSQHSHRLHNQSDTLAHHKLQTHRSWNDVMYLSMATDSTINQTINQSMLTIVSVSYGPTGGQLTRILPNKLEHNLSRQSGPVRLSCAHHRLYTPRQLCL